MSGVWFDHIAIGVPHIGDALPFLVGELGGRPAGSGTTRAFAFRQWHFGGGKLEVLEPAGAPGGFMHRFLERRGAGVHHVTFEVPDLDGACARAEAMGFSVVERDDSDPEWSEAFLHPKTAMSIVVQIVQVRRAGPSPVGVGGPGAGVHELPIVAPEPGDPEPGALGIELIGLRLAARSLTRARELWCDLLSGSCRSLDGALDIRWPGSPMRLLVRRCAADGDEGPLSIEIACLRPAVIPVGAHPVLGASFETVDITELPPPPAEGEPPQPIAPAEPTGAAAADGETYFLDADALEEEDRDRS
jgi:hypothetical protein